MMWSGCRRNVPNATTDKTVAPLLLLPSIGASKIVKAAVTNNTPGAFALVCRPAAGGMVSRPLGGVVSRPLVA